MFVLYYLSFTLVFLLVLFAVRSLVNRRVDVGPQTHAAMKKYLDPVKPEDQILYFESGKKRVILDISQEMITFVKCHTSNGFLTLWSSAEHSCPVTDVLDVYHQPQYHEGSGPLLGYETRIVTTGGKACIFLEPDDLDDEELRPIREYLAVISVQTRSAGFSQSPAFMNFIAVIAFIVASVLAVLFSFVL